MSPQIAASSSMSSQTLSASGRVAAMRSNAARNSVQVSHQAAQSTTTTTRSSLQREAIVLRSAAVAIMRGSAPANDAARRPFHRRAARNRRADPPRVVEHLALRIGPILAPYAHVQPLRKSLRQAIGQCLEHDRAVVVLHRLELGEFSFDAQPRGAGARTGVVLDPRTLRHDEVGETIVGLARWPNVLLPEVAPRQCDRRARRVGVELDIVAH